LKRNFKRRKLFFFFPKNLTSLFSDLAEEHLTILEANFETARLTVLILLLSAFNFLISERERVFFQKASLRTTFVFLLVVPFARIDDAKQQTNNSNAMRRLTFKPPTVDLDIFCVMFKFE